jgi:predicted ferric reductase
MNMPMRATPIRTRAANALLAALACLPVAIWWSSVQHPMAYLRIDGLPSGQSLFVLAKLAGLLAVVALWIQAMLALAGRVPLLRVLPASTPRQHRRLGMLTALLVLAHVVLFIVATTLRKKALAIDLLWPNLDHGYYFFNVSLGAFAFWLMVLTVFAGWRTARGDRRWRAVHLLWPVLVGLVFFHAMDIGSESRYGAMRGVMVALAITVGMAGVARVMAMLRRQPSMSKESESRAVR